MQAYVVCKRCGAKYRQPNEGTGSATALRDLDRWIAQHKLECTVGPAAFKLINLAR